MNRRDFIRCSIGAVAALVAAPVVAKVESGWRTIPGYRKATPAEEARYLVQVHEEFAKEVGDSISATLGRDIAKRREELVMSALDNAKMTANPKYGVNAYGKTVRFKRTLPDGWEDL
jgi:hypothetical protein